MIVMIGEVPSWQSFLENNSNREEGFCVNLPSLSLEYEVNKDEFKMYMEVPSWERLNWWN